MCTSWDVARLNRAGWSLFLILSLWLPGLARARGTHFLVEPFSGMVVRESAGSDDAIGLESGALLAVGGKLKGFPPRFYLYFKTSRAQFGENQIDLSNRQATAHVQRAFTRISGGLRVVIPLLGHVRLNLEFGGGSLRSSNRYEESGMDTRKYDENLSVFEAGLGLNVRLVRWLSLGVMYDVTYLAENERGDLIQAMTGDDFIDPIWSSLVGTLGFHF
jgi:hypothetical protein